MWDPQVPALAERYRVVTYDTRGHGESPAPAGPYTLDDLVDDVVALLDEVGAERAHVVGLSLGGHDRRCGWPPASPHRVDRLAVLCTSAQARPAARSSTGRPPSAPAGTAPLAPAVVGRWLTPAFAAAHPDLVARLEAMIAGADDEGYAACCEVVGRPGPARGPRPDHRARRWSSPAPRTWRCRPEHQRADRRRASRAPSCSP